MLGHRQLSPAEFLGVWRRRWKWALVPVLFGAAAGLLLARVVPPRFTSSATVRAVAPPAEVILPSPDFTGPRLIELKSQVLTRERVDGLIARFGLYSSPGSRISETDAAARMEKDVVISPASGGFTISFTASDAAIAQQVCAEIVSQFRQEEVNYLLRRGGNRDAGGSVMPQSAALGYLNSQLDEAKRDLDRREAKLSEFKRQHAAELSGAGGRQAENRIADYETQLRAVDVSMNRALQQRTALMESLFSPQTATVESRQAAERPATEALEQELATEQAQLVTLQARYTPDYPDVVKLKSDIAQLQKKIAEAKKGGSEIAAKKPAAPAPAAAPQAAQIQAQIRELDVQIQEGTREQGRLQQDILDARTRLDSRPLLDQEYKEISADAAAAHTRYTDLLNKRSMLLKATQTPADPLRVVVPPNLPEQPSFPNPLTFLLAGAGAGFAIGLLGMIGGELNDKSLRTEGDVEHFLELPTLAVIPAAGEGGANRDSGPRGGRTGNRGEKEEGVLADV